MNRIGSGLAAQNRRGLLCGLLVLGTGTCFGQSEEILARPQQVEPEREIDVLHYELRLDLDLEQKLLKGRTTVRFQSLRTPLARCELDAATFQVNSVRSEADEPLRFRQAGNRLAVELATPLEFGDRSTFTVEYSATNPRPDATAFGMAADFPLGLRFEDAAGNSPAHVATQSFPTGARHWFPCQDDPADKATSDIYITLNQDLRALSNGRLLSITKKPKNGRHTYHWSQQLQNATYLFALVAGPYEILKDRYGPIPLGYWVFPDDLENAARTFQKTPEILAFFSERFGFEYPWPKYDQITIPKLGGGAESTSATILGSATLHDARAEQDFPSAWLIAHEAAHQWWGNLITYRHWTHTWLSESFATYSEYLFSHHDLGPDEGALNLQRKRSAYLTEARLRYQRPIVCDRWDHPGQNFDRHTYEKGAAVLHMLRFVLGDEAFFESCRRFLTRHAFQSVETRDFVTTVRDVSGRDLSRFFEQWLDRPGHPVFEVSKRHDSATGKLHLKVAQVQDLSAGTPVYQLPVLIGITTPKGQRIERVALNNAVEEFVFDCEQPPLLVRFDQGNHLLGERRIEQSTAELLYQLEYDDTQGRAHAATQLEGRLDQPAVRDALLKAARQDAFWNVRATAVTTLGRRVDPELRSSFQALCLDEKSAVRAAALDALAALTDPSLAPFLRGRFEQDDSYVAQAAALSALGSCGDDRDLPFLEAAVGLESPRHLLRTAATAALRRIRSTAK